VVAAAVVVIVAAVVGNALAGGGAAVVAAIAAEIAVLSFVTLRAYPPGVKRPMAMFVVLTLLVSALFPLIYLSWLWVTKKKWYEAGLQEDRPDGVALQSATSSVSTVAVGEGSEVMAAGAEEDGYKTWNAPVFVDA